MPKKSEIKVSTIINLWLDTIKISVKPSTYATYYSTVHNHIIKKIGNLSGSQMNKELLDKFIVEQYNSGRLDGKGGLSSKTITDISSILNSILKFAYENRHIKHNHFTLVRPRQEMKEIEVLTKSEQTRLEQFICNKLDTQTAGILICLYSGIRIGEVCALKKEDINLNERVLRVNKSMQRIKDMDSNAKTKTKVIIDSPKSKKPRYIPIPSFILEIISPIYKDMNEECYILTGTNKYIEPRTYRNIFKKYLYKSNVREVNFHVLRHTFATRCVESDFDIKTLSEILGHADIRITLNTYVHSSYGQKCKQMEKLKLLCS